MEELITIEQLAGMVPIGIDTLRWYRSTGRGGPKSGKLGRRVVYRRADVEAWIASAFEDSAV